MEMDRKCNYHAHVDKINCGMRTKTKRAGLKSMFIMLFSLASVETLAVLLIAPFVSTQGSDIFHFLVSYICISYSHYFCPSICF
jgi:hypothetical protein